MTRLITLATCFCFLVACTTTTAIKPTFNQQWMEAVKPGAELSVVLLNGNDFDITVEKISVDSFVGRQADGKRFTFYIKTIDEIRIKKSSPEKTAALSAGIVAGVAATLVVGTLLILYGLKVIFRGSEKSDS